MPAGAKPGERRGGRQQGTPNKTTRDVREAIAAFAEANVDKMGEWLAAVADGDAEQERKADPGKALDLYLRAIEYHIPKLGRTELTGKDGKSLLVTLSEADGRI